MAVTQNTYTGDGSTVLYSFTFPYLTQTDVKVKLDGATQATTAYSFANATTVQMGSAPGSGVKVIIYRDTDNDNKKATFYPGSAIKAEDLNDNYDQILYVAQEVDNNSMSSLGDTPMQGDMEFAQGMGLVFEGATTDNFETRLAVADPTADRTVTLPNVTGTVITTGDTGTVTSAMITDATIVNADINASAAIAQSKLNIANATTSAAGYQSAADKTKLDGIETAATADQTNAEIRAAVEAATDSNVFTDADHTKLNAIEASATADQTAAEIRTLVESASDSNVFTDADHTKLNNIETAATADQTASEIKSLIASSPLDASHLAADSVTTSELADAELTTLAGMQSGTASILASGTALTSTTTELNQLDGKTLGETTLTTNSNTAIPTSKAVNDRIVSVTNALGGFVAIADKDNFPTSHPDPGEDAGTVVSISNAVGISVNSSGVGSLATRAGGSDAVVINGFPSALRGGATVGGATNANPYVLPANVGLQVQTTSTAHTYDYHKYLINEEDANKLSGDIQDFQERYRVSSSAPTSSLNDGDLYFDTTQNKMKVYNLSSTSWDDVATPGNFFISTLSPAFDGSTTQFTITNGPNSAQQIILSLNGVVQKPGTAFTLSGSTVTFASAPVSGSDYFAVVMGSAVNIGTPSNNTVTTAILQNGSCTTDKLSTDSVTGAKIADDAVGAEHIEVLDANLQFADNAKAQFGTTDNDLEIYHNSNNSYIQDTGTGNLHLTSNGTAVSIDKGTSENMAVFNVDGAVDLYYDGVLKCSTYGDGLNFPDLGTLALGASNDMKLYHYNNNNYIVSDGGDLYIDTSAGHAFRIKTDQFNMKNAANSATLISADNGGAVSLFYDNVKRLETTANGAKVTGSSGSYALEINHPDWNTLQLVNTNNDQYGPYLDLFHASSSPADGDEAGEIRFLANDDAGGSVVYGQMRVVSYDVSNGSEDGQFEFFTRNNDSLTEKLRITSDGKVGIGASPDQKLHVYESATDSQCYLHVQNNRSRNAALKLTTTQGNWYVGQGIGNDSHRFMIYDSAEKLGIGSGGETKISANKAGDYALFIQNDGDSTNRYGALIQCGKDNNAGTNYALGVADGDGGTQGYLTFNAGTLALDPFTAAHPCIIPDADNPSDDSMAYPYGTLLETTAIEYKKKKDGTDTERGILYKVQKTQLANSKKVLGAYAGSLNNGPDNHTNMHHAYVLGDGHILVNNAGGNIEVGDGICSSATAGIGQKATANPSMIIGIAQEAITFTGSETKLVAVQYGLQQFIPWT